MQTKIRFPVIWRMFVGVSVFLVFSLLAFKPSVAARTTGAESDAFQSANPFDTTDTEDFAESESPEAACAGGPTIDGVLLNECYIESFLVGGVSKSIRVWYTKTHTAASRVVDGNTVNLQHWIDTDAQAQLVAQRGREAFYHCRQRGAHRRIDSHPRP